MLSRTLYPLLSHREKVGSKNPLILDTSRVSFGHGDLAFSGHYRFGMTEHIFKILFSVLLHVFYNLGLLAKNLKKKPAAKVFKSHKARTDLWVFTRIISFSQK